MWYFPCITSARGDLKKSVTSQNNKKKCYENAICMKISLSWEAYFSKNLIKIF